MAVVARSVQPGGHAQRVVVAPNPRGRDLLGEGALQSVSFQYRATRACDLAVDGVGEAHDTTAAADFHDDGTFGHGSFECIATRDGGDRRWSERLAERKCVDDAARV